MWKLFSEELPPESDEPTPNREYWFLVNYSQSKSKTPKVCFRRGETLYREDFKPWRRINSDTVVRWTSLPKLIKDSPKPLPCERCGTLGCGCWWDEVDKMNKPEGYEILVSFNTYWVMDLMPRLIYNLYDIYPTRGVLVTKTKCFTNFEILCNSEVVCEILTNFGDYRFDDYEGDGILVRSVNLEVVAVVKDLLKEYVEIGDGKVL